MCRDYALFIFILLFLFCILKICLLKLKFFAVLFRFRAEFTVRLVNPVSAKKNWIAKIFSLRKQP